MLSSEHFRAMPLRSNALINFPCHPQALYMVSSYLMKPDPITVAPVTQAPATTALMACLVTRSPSMTSDLD